MPHWHAHPDVWLLILAIGGCYAWAVRRIGPRVVHPIERVVTRRQVLLFAAGLLAMWVAADWPVHDLAERSLYSVHMVQHLTRSLVAAPLLIIGTPDWMMRKLLTSTGLMPVARFVTRPLVGFVLFNTVIAIIHVPAVVDASTRSELSHFGLHTALFLTALCMWSPVLNPMIELPKLSYPGRMVYIFLQSLVPTIPASFLTFGSTVLYHHYASVPRLWGISALSDQRVAGLIMKLGGGALLWGVMSWYFFKWFALEERENVDVLEWSKIERDLNQVELPKTTS
jgi:putative membrane protein